MRIEWDNRPEPRKIGAFKAGDVFQYGDSLFLHCGSDSEGGFTVVDLAIGNVQTMAGTVNVYTSTAKVVVE
jgi:hypothetical protein